MKYNYTTSLKKRLKSPENTLKQHFIGGVIRSFSKQPIPSLFLPIKTQSDSFYYPPSKKNLNFFPKRLNFSIQRSYY